jgi:subfamily B ATP-binding cassette protein MsbA
MRKSLYEKITSLHIGYFHNRQKGDILSLFSSDVLEIENSIVGSLTVLLKELVMLIGYFVVLFFISIKLTLFTLLVFPLAGLMVSLINKRIKQYAVNSQEVLGSILTTIEETVSGLRIIKAFNAESFVNNRFEGQNKHYRFLLKKLWNRRDLASPLSEILGVLIVVSVLLYGGTLVIDSNSDLKPSEFITFILIYTQVMAPIKSLAGTATTIQRGVASGERIFQLLDSSNPISKNENAAPFTEFKHEIEFRNVSFSYGERKVLENVSFVLPKGKMLALVGPSGSGKSTLADLLPRFIEVQSGQILIDGRDVKAMRLRDLRALLGIVTQESILFNDTIESNIRFNTTASIAEVEDAARIAHATEFIQKLPEKMEAIIGDRGGKLSGGQRQRLNIARAVLRNPPVLILDEATSALDTESEKLVQDALTKLMNQRTSLVIAHRLSTIQHADEILVLQEGKIVERGRHEELKATGGLYSRMINMQGFTS